MTRATFSSPMPVPASDLDAWHRRPGAFQRLVPPWERVEVVSEEGVVPEPGSRVTIRTRIGPIWKRWVAVHSAIEGRGFRDEQVAGPFRRWVHTHEFSDDGAGGSVLTDTIDYALPGGPLGRWLGGAMTKRRLETMFAHRHATTAADLAAHKDAPKMKIHVTGAGGMVGSALLPFLGGGGHEHHAVRREGARFLFDDLEGADAIVHLAGESIADGRWNDAKKERIRKSRIEGTHRVATRAAGLNDKPEVLVCASAVGYYGDRGDELLEEEAAPGDNFLAGVCREWEQAADPARAAGIRVVHLRFGVILHPGGGALKKMLLPFRLGVGGRIGSGTQWMSWITLDDVVAAIYHAILDDSLSGPVNAVAPGAVTNREYTKALGRALGRPSILPMPAFAARLAFGEMADELLLASARVHPTKLIESGFRFRDPDLEHALRGMLGTRKGNHDG